jgi:choline kinase
VDYEYASPNPASFDIANHFHEWTANYHGPEPQKLDPSRYPTAEERYNFYTAYLDNMPVPPESLPQTVEENNLEMKLLDDQVRYWSPASHAMWAIWGIVQAREDVEAANPEPEFDYLGYALCRMAGFRREVAALHI